MKALKGILIGIVVIAVLLFAGLYALESYIEKQISKEESVEYDEFELNYKGDIQFKGLRFTNDRLSVKVKDIQLTFGLSKILFSDTILITNADLNDVHVDLIKADSTKSKKQNFKKKKDRKPFALEDLNVSNLDFYALKEDSLGKIDTMTYVNGVTLNAHFDDLKDIQLSNLKDLKVDYLRHNAGVLHDIGCSGLTYGDQQLKLDNFKVFTRYSKEDYINYIPEQKEHVQLVAHALSLDSLTLDINQNKLNQIAVNEIQIDSFDLDVYRDKTIPQTTQIKPTYGQIFQNLGFKIDGNLLKVDHSSISYAMKGEDGKISQIELKNVHANVKHINNKPELEQNILLIGGFSLGETSDVNVDISYNQYAKVETFQLNVHAQNIETSSLNSMLKPAVNVELTGFITELKSHMVSKGDADGSFMLKSQDVALDVYNKKGKERKVVSFLASKLLNPPIEKHSEVVGFERDPTRSMWRYSWYFILEGLKNTIL